jgi:hypothetical protein
VIDQRTPPEFTGCAWFGRRIFSVDVATASGAQIDAVLIDAVLQVP